MDKLVSESALSNFFPEARLICRVCQKQFSQYTCPRCNTRYCSLECYKRHSLRCTESFMRENVIEELHQIQCCDETRRKMQEILRRVHSEDDKDSDGEDGSILSEETVTKFLSGGELKLNDLSPGEIKKFQRAVANGEMSKLIEPWHPWWTKPSAASISLGPNGNQLVKQVEEEENLEGPLGTSEFSISEIPAGPENPLPPLHQLSRTEPSPLLSVHLIDIIYSYCFTLRLYNGDWHFDPLGAATVVLTLSSVLGCDGRPETVSEALAACMEQTCSPALSHAGGFNFGLMLIDDAICLLSLGANAIICSLCNLCRLIQAGSAMLKSD
ncbi:zinc finger HIT domain-containing protein 2, partial [Phalaenopsis equestris]|uniref:zinc finger HIT domain-containing protein 2 n=1 Tax=Phalaenopsis equestris TaxID=78828 RepID=UPI0009E355AB